MKRHAKIFLSGLLVSVLSVTTLIIPSYAAERTETAPNGNTVVEYKTETTWTAEIPSYVEPQAADDEMISAYQISLEDAVIPSDCQLDVSVEYSGLVTEENGVTIPYMLYDASGAEIKSGTKVLTKTSGSPETAATTTFGSVLSEEPKYSGIYSDTAVFNFNVTEKTYTMDEINADEHLYAIGKTKPEYVIAKFNEDYSESIIFKNGEDSDGEMRHWSLMDSSPMVAKRNTLKNVVIANGVKNIGDSFFDGASIRCDLSIPESVSEIEQNSLRRLEAENISVTDSNTSYCSVEGVLFTKDKKQLLKFPTDRELNNYEIPLSVTTIWPCAFCDAGALSIIVPENVSNIGERAFFRGVKAINVSERNQKYKSIDGVLFTKDGTTLLQYPRYKKDNIYVIPETTTNFDKDAFFDIYNLKEVTIPGTVQEIPEGAFQECFSLTKININDGVKTIGNHAFMSMSSLENRLYINLPSSVVSIGESAFFSFDIDFRVEVRAPTGSYAETWANQNGYTFVAI